MTESHQDNYDEIYRQAERLESELRTEEARELFERAAEAGHAGSMFKLGTIYDGLGAVAGARQWYMRAIRSGDSASMFNLARLEEEVGDLLAARHWYERAAKAGDSGAMHNLGVLLQRMGELTLPLAGMSRAPLMATRDLSANRVRFMNAKAGPTKRKVPTAGRRGRR